MTNQSLSRSQTWSIVLLVALILLLGTGSAQARDGQGQAPGTETLQFNISASPLSEALATFRAITGWTVVVTAAGSDTTVTAHAVSGTFSAGEALRRMLNGTGLAFTMVGFRDAALTRAAVRLAPLAVVGREGGYQAPGTSTLTKTETPLRDVPQAVGIVTRQAIADQQMASLADVVRYVPGVTMGQGEGNRDQPQFRGNSGNGDLFVDGVRDDVEYLRDLYNVDRVEVPKGSNAMIFGRGAGGGLINRVTKQAGWTPVQSLSLQGGSYQNRRGAIDLDHALGQRVAGRVNGMFENSNSYRDEFNLKRYGVAPTVTLSAGPRTRIRAAYEFFKDERTADRGIPSFNGAPLDTDPSTFFGDPSVSWSHAKVNSVGGTIDHQTGFGLKIRNNTRFADYRKMYQNIYPGAVNTAATQVQIVGYNNRMWRTNLFNQTDLTYTLNTGSVKHLLLAGGELGRQSTDAYRNTAYFNNSTTSVTVPVTVPITTGTPVTFRQSATDADAHTTAVVASGYLQDQIRIVPQLLVVLGARLDRFDLQYHNNRTNTDLSRTDEEISPRLGLVIKPVSALSMYGSYSVSFLPSSGSLFTSLNVTTRTLEPEQFTNYEIGTRWEPRRDLSLTAAVYRLDRTNTSAPDPADPSHTIQTGAQRSKGLELSATGNLTDDWQVLAGYTYADVKITSRTTAATVGSIPALAPKHTFSVWNKYQVTPNVGAGVGLLRQARTFAAVDDAVTIPGFTRVDAAVFFRLNRRLGAQVNIENIFDVKYFSTANSNNNITPGSPRAVRAGVTLGY